MKNLSLWYVIKEKCQVENWQKKLAIYTNSWPK